MLLLAWIFGFVVLGRAADSELQISVRHTVNDLVLEWPSSPGEKFLVERRSHLSPAFPWQALHTNVRARVSLATTEFVHTNALLLGSGFYRVARETMPAFSFTWSGTNFTYSDSNRTFTGILLKPPGDGPFPAVLIQHGAGGAASGYSLSRAREMVSWGLVCIGPNLTHVGGGETNVLNMGFCPENLARAEACLKVLASLPYVDTNRVALFGHSMGAFATIGDAAVWGGRVRAAAIVAGGINENAAGTSNAAPTVAEAQAVRTPFLMVHCDGDPVVRASRSELFQQLLNANAISNQRILISSNSIPNQAHWHNLHNDAGAHENVLTNTRAWFRTYGVLE